MRCGQCGDTIVGKPGYESTSSSGGWCGSPRRTKRWVVCQDCTGDGEYQQHLYRLKLQAEMVAHREIEESDDVTGALAALAKFEKATKPPKPEQTSMF